LCPESQLTPPGKFQKYVLKDVNESSGLVFSQEKHLLNDSFLYDKKQVGKPAPVDL